MADPIRIANCSGYYGDRLSAAREMVTGGPIDVLTGDWLAELTMLILSRTRAKHPGGGYARTFVAQMGEVMADCLERGIKVVSNAGGLDPAGCAEAVALVADQLGLSPSIAIVSGDDLMPRLAELAPFLEPFDEDSGLGDPDRYLTANAYLGCWGIVDALERGADIVISGRVTDAAVVCGPAAWHHGWRRDDWDALAGGVVAGHVLECSTQATGGNYSFFTEIEGYADPARARFGFPWADVAADGTSVIGKHHGTGGAINIGTVTSQLLYEIGAPAYPGPDVTARFDTISLDHIDHDRVLISGVKGEPPPPTLKVGINELGGYRNSFSIALTGLDIAEKAEFVQASFWDRCPLDPADFDVVSSQVVRTEHPDPDTNERATASWRLTVKDADADKVGRAFSDAVVQTFLASIPGMYALSGRPGDGEPFGVFRPALISAEHVPAQVAIGGQSFEVGSEAPPGRVVIVAPPEPQDAAPTGPTVEAALGRVIGTRSGDKGGDANLGVFTRSDPAFVWLDGFLTTYRLRELLPETADLVIERYRLPNLRALNFVIRGLLQEGVAAATRQDAQAKSLGEWLRARTAPIPEVLIRGR